MPPSKQPLRILYSFPHKLGADRICYTAWEQVNGLASLGAEVLAFPGCVQRSVSARVTVRPTLAFGKVRVPYKLLGTQRACDLHDHIVAMRLERLRGKIDIVHAWPLGALRSFRVTARLGIPAVLERPNAHTGVAYEVVRRESERLGVKLPPGSEHAYNETALRREEQEYEAAFRLLCPSQFVVDSFVRKGFSEDRCVRHTYGYDEERFYPGKSGRVNREFTILFAGFSAVRKGLHFALEAWLRSPAHSNGRFLIAGGFLPAYASKIKDMLAHPSVTVLGHRTDIPELMRRSDVLVLPSVEEGFGLVCVEAMASGCVPLVSSACTDVCRHMNNALVHDVGDVEALSEHMTMLAGDPGMLKRFRGAGLDLAPDLTWTAAGERLLNVYREVIAQHSNQEIGIVA